MSDMTECGHSKYDPCHNCEPVDTGPHFQITVKDGDWTGTWEEWRERNSESQRVRLLRERVAALEAMRPQWAMGYSDDSIAAQCSTASLTQLWTLLGVDNQTQAVQAIKELLAGKLRRMNTPINYQPVFDFAVNHGLDYNELSKLIRIAIGETR